MLSVMSDPASSAAPAEPMTKAEVENLSFYYGANQALDRVSLSLADRRITALIGASGCGKSTFLRCFNRMHDLYPDTRYQGRITLYPEGLNIIDPAVDPLEIRLRIGMVFQKPNPFPKSIFDNVAYGLRVRGIKDNHFIEEQVEYALRQASLWSETADRLQDSAMTLSGGQQQRLCIARALAPRPDLLLLDEPTSALDPIATANIEELLSELKEQVTILIVTHNMQQAARVSDYTAFMHLGQLVEFGDTDKMFTLPRQKKTEDYITGRYG